MKKNHPEPPNPPVKQLSFSRQKTYSDKRNETSSPGQPGENTKKAFYPGKGCPADGALGVGVGRSAHSSMGEPWCRTTPAGADSTYTSVHTRQGHTRQGEAVNSWLLRVVVEKGPALQSPGGTILEVMECAKIDLQ